MYQTKSTSGVTVAMLRAFVCMARNLNLSKTCQDDVWQAAASGVAVGPSQGTYAVHIDYQADSYAAGADRAHPAISPRTRASRA